MKNQHHLDRRMVVAAVVTSLVLLGFPSIAGSFSEPLGTLHSAFATSVPTGTAPINDRYANFSGYESYLQSFYQPSMNGFRAYPLSDPSGGDYYNYWMDDAGKMLSSFATLGDTTYAGYATNFIMNNAINDSGYIYLPERVINSTDRTYLHVNRTALASPDFPITYTPVQNPSFELDNTSLVNGVPVDQPFNWADYISGSGGAHDINSTTGASDGQHYASTNTTGAGTVAYYQKSTANQLVIYAHDDPGIGENGGLIGNFTASYLSSPYVASTSANSSHQMTWSYVSYPAFASDTIFPANSQFQITTYISANQSLTGVTYGVQVNEVCNGYRTETSPWGGEVTSTVNIGTTPQAFTGTVSTGSSNFIFGAGCALHLIVYINPNTPHFYTFDISYDSKQYETHTVVPFLPTVSQLDNSGSTLGFTLKPLTGTSGYFFALITSAGSLVLSSGGVNTNAIPNIVSPIYTTNFQISPGRNLNWSSFNYDAASLASASNLSGDGVIEYIEFGVDSSQTSIPVYGSWDDVYYIVDVGEGNSPIPSSSSQYLVGGYYYANNGIVGLSNVSSFTNNKVYEQSMSAGIITDTENRTTYGFLDNPSIKQAFGSSPFISDFFVWDLDYNATGEMLRQILPYSINVGQVPYRLYVSGGNGSNLNIDFWIGVDESQNIYTWINATISAGQDYIEPSLALYNLGIHSVQINDLNYGLGSFDTFMRYNPYWSWLQLSNGTVVKMQHGFNDSTSNPNSTIYSSSTYGGVSPTALLWTGFSTPEFADGLLIKPLQPSSVEEIDFVSNFFGHSLRLVMNENGKVIPPGGQSDTFSFQFTPMAKTLWTEPNALLSAFLHGALVKNGLDISMPGSWGIDSYALAQWAQQSGNTTVLKFAHALWNSEYQDVIQRLHPANSTFYNPTQQPEIYYRSLYAFALAGLVLYPNNSTTYQFAQQAAKYGISEQLTPYGLPDGLEEDGWAVHLLSTLYSDTSLSQQNLTARAEYLGNISSIVQGFRENTTYTQVQTLSSWNLTASSNLDYTPSVWNLNSSGLPNPGVYCNHPNIVFRCGEMSWGVLSDFSSYGLVNYWSNSAFLTSFSLLEAVSNPVHSAGLSVDVRYADNSGNSNTETQPVSVLGLLMWMNAMSSSSPGGSYISSIRNAEISSIKIEPAYQGKYTALVINLQIPPGNSASMTFNTGSMGSPDILTDNTQTPMTTTYNETSGDLVLGQIYSSVIIGWYNSGGGNTCPPACGGSSGPLIVNPLTIFAAPGQIVSANLVLNNSESNVTSTLSSVSFNASTIATKSISISTTQTSGLPAPLGAFRTENLPIKVSVSNKTADGIYLISGVIEYSQLSGTSSGSSHFTVVVHVVGSCPTCGVGPGFWWTFLVDWWMEMVAVAVIAIFVSVLIIRRRV